MALNRSPGVFSKPNKMRQLIADALFLFYIRISLFPVISSYAEKRFSNALEMFKSNKASSEENLRNMKKVTICGDSIVNGLEERGLGKNIL